MTMPPSYALDHAGRRIEVRIDDPYAPQMRIRDLRVRLVADGHEVDAVRLDKRRLVLRNEGVEVRVRLSHWGNRARSAELVLPEGGVLPLVEVPPVPDPPEPGDGTQPTAAEQPWRLPEKGTPERAKLWCGAAIAVTVGYSFALNPFMPMLLQAPLVLATLTGSRTAMVLLGASAAVGRTDLWWLGLLLATVSVLKFGPLYWWAGRLWGDRFVRFVRGGREVSPRALEIARRWWVLAVVASYVPGVPVHSAVVYSIVGAMGVRLRTLLMVDLVAAFATRCLWLYLGFRLGQPVLDVVDAIAEYSLWLSLALVVSAAVLPALHRRRQGRSAPRT